MKPLGRSLSPQTNPALSILADQRISAPFALTFLHSVYQHGTKRETHTRQHVPVPPPQVFADARALAVHTEGALPLVYADGGPLAVRALVDLLVVLADGGPAAVDAVLLAPEMLANVRAPAVCTWRTWKERGDVISAEPSTTKSHRERLSLRCSRPFSAPSHAGLHDHSSTPQYAQHTTPVHTYALGLPPIVLADTRASAVCVGDCKERAGGNQ